MKMNRNDLENSEYEQAENWYNTTSKKELIDFATKRGLDIGQEKTQLDDDWNEKIIEDKYREITDV